MPDTTLEQASRCPKCDEPGIKLNSRQAPRGQFSPGTRVDMFECRSDRCPEYMPPQTAGPSFSTMPASRNRWVVQINPDGTIPPKNIGSSQDKAFAGIPEGSDLAQRARDQLRFMAAQDSDPDGKGTREIGRDLGYY